MAEILTPQQRLAVNYRGGSLLVSAAAGSGKTKVLVDRLMLYLTDPVQPANLDDFLIITYTKAAAGELRSKIAAKLNDRIAENPGNRHLQQQLQRLYLANISTVHGFCTTVLRQYAYKLDIRPDFRVADENECRALRETAIEEVLNRAYESLGEDGDFVAFVDSQGLGHSDAIVPVIVQKVYDSAMCHLDPGKWLSDCVENAVMKEVSDAGQTLWGKYLMDDLFRYLDWQIDAMRRCAELAERAGDLQKPAALFRDTVNQLQHLRQSDSWDAVLLRQNIRYGTLSFPKNMKDTELAERLKAVRNNCKDGLGKKLRSFADPSQQILSDLSGSAAACRGLIRLVQDFEDRYSRLKRSRGIMDFADLEHKTVELLLDKHRALPTSDARQLGMRFRQILVDEYQDSNAVQDAIFTALSWQRDNLFMVGDVKQSIYQFRQADPSIFLEKYSAYSPAETALPGQGSKVLLSQNFRSGGAVLEAVNHVFQSCMTQAVGGLEYGTDEKLVEGLSHGPLGEPDVEFHVVNVREETYREEPYYAAQRIAELLDGSHYIRQGDTLRPIRPEDIVILLRSPDSVGRYYQSALQSRGIRCTSGANQDLLKTPEIQTLVSILQTISNPRQDIPLIAAITSPVFGFTADDLAVIRCRHRGVSFYDALLEDPGDKARNFLSLLTGLRKQARSGGICPVLEMLFTGTRMDVLYESMAGGAEKAANLRSFYQLASGFESVSVGDLDQFLEYLEKLGRKGLAVTTEGGAGAVTIMSIHRSKGLEFPVVFLCGLSRRFNRDSLKAQVLCDKDLGLGMSCVDTENRIRYPGISKRAIASKIVSDSLSEEMRVLYVAMTRAKDRLIMTYAARNPEMELSEFTGRMGICGRELMASDVTSIGEWVLYSALMRIEAGALHALGGRPQELVIGRHPWRIDVVEAPEAEEFPAAEITPGEQMPNGYVEAIREGLSFRYGNMEATAAPSKQTATQRKGRLKDQEAAEHTRDDRSCLRSWRKPSFVEASRDRTAAGTATHTLLQYIRFSECSDVQGIRRELQRLTEAGLILPEYSGLVDCDRIACFFASELGRKIRSAERVLREFKFTILEDGSQYSAGLEGEKVLLQGVVDCALVEEDGITIIDFKTDHVNEETLEAAAGRYNPQVRAYAEAMARIYETKVKHAYLYFFRMDKLWEV